MKFAMRPGSLAIDASAGYGKTEILCSRLLAILLADPGDAHRLAALTFTRAAAAEIYTRLLTMLVEALKDDAGTAKLRCKLGELVAPGAFDGVEQTDLLHLLRLLVDGMGTLNISTIDGFFYRLVRAFAVELGLPGTAELAPDGGERLAAAELLKELFAAGADHDFISACRESRYGEENKRFFDTCLELVESAARFRSRKDEPEFWGGPFRIFRPADASKLASALETCENHDWGKADYRGKLRPLLLDCARAKSGGYRFGRSSQEALRRFLKVWDDFPAVKPEKFRSNWNFPEPSASTHPS